MNSNHKATRVAGVMFLLCFIVPTFNWALGLSKLVDAKDFVTTVNNIAAHELLFRIGITVELFMAAGLVVLAAALYTILKPVSRLLARLALLLKLVEAGLSAAIVLILFSALQMPGDMRTTLGVLLNAHTVLYSIPMVFLGLDMMLFFYLFFQSRYIPRWLAGFGIFSFFLILVHSLLNILAPHLGSMVMVQAGCFIPSCIVELVVGPWLLVKGLNIQQD